MHVSDFFPVLPDSSKHLHLISNWCCYLMNYFATPFMRCMDVHVNSQTVMCKYLFTCNFNICQDMSNLISGLSAPILLFVVSDSVYGRIDMFMQILTSIFCVKQKFLSFQSAAFCLTFVLNSCLSKFVIRLLKI